MNRRKRTFALGLWSVVASFLVPAASYAASPPVACQVTFGLAPSAELGALQFRTDYSLTTGGFVGSANLASCTNSSTYLFAVNDDDGTETLHSGYIGTGGLMGPTNFTVCNFESSTVPLASDFVVTVEDSPAQGSALGNSRNVCGAPETGASPPFARDAVVILGTAVGLPGFTCDLCEGDVNFSGTINATDSLIALRNAVGLGLSFPMSCPVCVGPPTASAASASVVVGVGVDCTYTCPPTRDLTCGAGTKSQFSVKNDLADDTRDQLKWKLTGGPATAQSDLGPVISTEYTLCVYDTIGLSDVLAAQIVVDSAGAGWTDKDPKGVAYKDLDALSDGVTKLQIKTGAAGESKVSLNARGMNIPLPAPANGVEFFDMQSAVVVQLHNSVSPVCWSAEFTGSTSNTPSRFVAKSPF